MLAAGRRDFAVADRIVDRCLNLLLCSGGRYLSALLSVVAQRGECVGVDDLKARTLGGSGHRGRLLGIEARGLCGEVLRGVEYQVDVDCVGGYRAAAGVFARIGACVDYTLFLISYLQGAGLIQLDYAVFTEPVTAQSNVDIEVKAYVAEVGSTPMPTTLDELDLSAWRPVHEDIELIGGTGEEATGGVAITPMRETNKGASASS